MPIHPNDRNLFIANALLFPPHFPELGIASVVDAESEFNFPAGGTRKPILLNFEEQHVAWSFVRRIQVEHVAAVFIPTDPKTVWSAGTWWDNGEWLAGPELATAPTLIETTNQDGPPDSQNAKRKYALLYVAENVPISNIVTFGASAADSHQFVPPVSVMGTHCCA